MKNENTSSNCAIYRREKQFRYLRMSTVPMTDTMSIIAGLSTFDASWGYGSEPP